MLNLISEATIVPKNLDFYSIPIKMGQLTFLFSQNYNYENVLKFEFSHELLRFISALRTAPMTKIS